MQLRSNNGKKDKIQYNLDNISMSFNISGVELNPSVGYPPYGYPPGIHAPSLLISPLFHSHIFGRLNDKCLLQNIVDFFGILSKTNLLSL